MKHLGLILAILFALSLFTSPATAGNAGEVLDFARHLFDQGDWFRAITEAKRFLFLAPQDPRRHEAHLLMGRAHFEAGQFEPAMADFSLVVRQTDRPELAAQALLDQGSVLERHRGLNEAILYYQDLAEGSDLPHGQDAEVRNIARMRMGWLLMKEGRFDEARSSFGAVSPDHKLGSAARSLAEKTYEAEHLDYKSPRTAGTLSAVLPGAGQLYVGRPTDAALAFGLNAAFLWGAIESYQDENWAAFAVLGVMEITWYGGNIYNAVNGAHRHNQDQRDRLIQRLQKEYGLTVGVTPTSQGPALALGFRF
jgi:hypothetical protein